MDKFGTPLYSSIHSDRAANKTELPSVSSASKYEDHFLSANSGKTAESAGSPYWKDAPANGKSHMAFCLSTTIDSEILSSFGEQVRILPGVVAANLPGLDARICNCDSLSRHFPNIRNASENELLVTQFLLFAGRKEAAALVLKLYLTCRSEFRGMLAHLQ
jgi:hypothetical protein